jgi:membrane protein
VDQLRPTGGLEARGAPARQDHRFDLERRQRPDRRHLERRQGERRRRASGEPPLRPGRMRRLRSRAGSLLVELKNRVSEDHVVIVGAGVAFSFFLAIFPTLFALVSIYGLVADTQTIESHLAWLSGLLPREALELVRGQLRAIAAAPRTALQWGTAISILVALWSAAGGTASLIEGLNIARDIRERRGLVRLRATALAFSLGFVMFLIVSVTLITAVPNVLAQLPLPDAFRMASQVAQWALLVALILVALRAVYRYGPALPVEPRRWLTPGAVVGALLWLAASALFSWYAASFGRFDKTHGALGAAVALLLWLQLSCVVVLIGAELDAALERRRRPPPHPV